MAVTPRGREPPERAKQEPRFSGMDQANLNAQANLNDRRSIERIYSPDAFARDAAENDRHRIEVLKGVRIASAPDADGNFALEPAAQYAGEVPGALFLAPFHRRTAEEFASDDPDPRHGYDAFIDGIIEAARRHGYRAEESPGPDDQRLRGPRQ
jgi:hypothetical protein